MEVKEGRSKCVHDGFHQKFILRGTVIVSVFMALFAYVPDRDLLCHEAVHHGGVECESAHSVAIGEGYRGSAMDAKAEDVAVS